jgi:hypothetical protein
VATSPPARRGVRLWPEIAEERRKKTEVKLNLTRKSHALVVGDHSTWCRPGYFGPFTWSIHARVRRWRATSAKVTKMLGAQPKSDKRIRIIAKVPFEGSAKVTKLLGAQPKSDKRIRIIAKVPFEGVTLKQ